MGEIDGDSNSLVKLELKAKPRYVSFDFSCEKPRLTQKENIATVKRLDFIQKILSDLKIIN